MKIGIRARLIGAFAVVLAFIVAVGATGIHYTNLLEAEFENLYTDNVTATVALANAGEALWQLRYGFPQYLVNKDPEDRDRITAAEPKWYRKIEEDMAIYAAGSRTAEEKQALREWTEVFEKYREARPRWFELEKAGRSEEAAVWRAKTTTPYGAASVAALGKLVELQQRRGSEKLAQVVEQSRSSNRILISLIGVAFALGLAASFVGDSILRKARDVGERLLRIHTFMASAVQQLRSSAAEIAAVSRQSEANAVTESAGIEETRRTMSALLESSNEIAQGAHLVLERAEHTAEASAEIADRISKLNAQASKITGITDTIQAIANKTDILALNASLEGSRAGEAGRGFVLLGTEMRRLAETVTAAASQIKELAGEVSDLSHAAVLAAEQGQKLSQETTDTARKITLITVQQRSGTEQVSRSMDEIQELMQQALGGTRQAKATADDLAQTADALMRTVEGGIQGAPPAAGQSM